MSGKWGVTHCPWCGKPYAQDEDYGRYAGDESRHLCWAQGAGLYESEKRERLIGVLEERDRLREACEATLEHIAGDGWDGNHGEHPDNPAPAQLRDALEFNASASTVRGARG